MEARRLLNHDNCQEAISTYECKCLLWPSPTDSMYDWMERKLYQIRDGS